MEVGLYSCAQLHVYAHIMYSIALSRGGTQIKIAHIHDFQVHQVTGLLTL